MHANPNVFINNTPKEMPSSRLKLNVPDITFRLEGKNMVVTPNKRRVKKSHSKLKVVIAGEDPKRSVSPETQGVPSYPSYQSHIP